MKWTKKKIEKSIIKLSKEIGRFPKRKEVIENYGYGIIEAIKKMGVSYSEFLINFKENSKLNYSFPKSIEKERRERKWDKKSIEEEFIKIIEKYNIIPSTSDLCEIDEGLYSAIKRNIRNKVFPNVNNYYEFIKYIKKEHPEVNKYQDSRLINIQRKNYNTEKIEKEFIEAVKKNGKIPTTRELEKETGGLTSLIYSSAKKGVFGEDIKTYSQFVNYILNKYPELKNYTTKIFSFKNELITPEILGTAIYNALNTSGNFSDKKECYDIAQRIMNLFGFENEVLDNILENGERSIFYLLEEFEILKSKHLDTIIPYDLGKTWRINLWKLNPEKIKEYFNLNVNSNGKEKNSEFENIYNFLSEDAWKRNNK
ncbi:MAG: DUF6015 family protein [Candidatus Aenigmatarchaeota archaeon]